MLLFLVRIGPQPIFRAFDPCAGKLGKLFLSRFALSLADCAGEPHHERRHLKLAVYERLIRPEIQSLRLCARGHWYGFAKQGDELGSRRVQFRQSRGVHAQDELLLGAGDTDKLLAYVRLNIPVPCLPRGTCPWLTTGAPVASFIGDAPGGAEVGIRLPKLCRDILF